jgi:tRNA threonylcarbamoyladenosine biosynthesis protein TsaE
MKETIETGSSADTVTAGESLAARLSPGDIVLLSGPLGAGKSTFARGIARGLGSYEWRGSPTYNLIHEYPTTPRLYHADLYRLAPDAFEDLGLEEYLSCDSIVVVEWPDRAPETLAALAWGRAIHVCIQPAGESQRIISLSDGEA